MPDNPSNFSVIDGGGISFTIDANRPIPTTGSSSFSLALSYMYNTGNCYNDFLNDYLDADIEVFTGNLYPFYKVVATDQSSSAVIPPTNFVFYPSDPNTVKSFSSSTGIFYSTTANSFHISGTHNYGVTKTSSSASHSVTYISNKTYYPHEFDPAKHLLIVYNQASQDSIDIKNYYLAARTGIVNPNVLGISCAPALSGDVTSKIEYEENIRVPILNYLQTNLDKPIRYIILLYDIGTRFSGYNGISASGHPDIIIDNVTGLYFGAPGYARYSVVQDLSDRLDYVSGWRSSLNFSSTTSTYLAPSIIDSSLITPDNYNNRYTVAQYSNTPVLVTHITARTKNDVSGYIKKITTLGVVSGCYLRGSGQNNTYLFNFLEADISGNSQTDYLRDQYSGIRIFCPSANSVLLLSGQMNQTNIPRITGGDLAGFMYRGIHQGYSSSNPIQQFYDGSSTYNGYIRFTGYNWYIMSSAESFNGINMLYDANTGVWTDAVGAAGMTHIFGWLRSNSFDSTNYEHCPVGCCGHATEPTEMVNRYPYFILWNSGLPFIEAAYRSRIYSNVLLGWTCNGDPLLLK
jgi:hypothetical protein